ncbi:MAG: HD domain-containing protein [Lachnospiraceae bacterium]|nr:HD domain-containing protein [Lachnospiraceae bacterium]
MKIKGLMITAAGLLAAVSLGICGLSKEVYANEPDSRDVFGTGADYAAILYDSSNGMPTSEANAIAQSSDGFIWLGGYSGLIRYDGTNFYRFDSSTGISSVFSLCVDDDDRIWIGTNEKGVACYDNGQFNVYGITDGIRSHSVRSMAVDGNGNILIGTTQGMCYVDSEKHELYPLNDIKTDQEYITMLNRASDGKVYGLTSGGSVFLCDGLKVEKFYDAEKFGEEPVNTIYPVPDKEGTLYLGTTGSDIMTVRFEGDKVNILSTVSVAPQKNINAMKLQGGNLWITATNGIGFIDNSGTYHEMHDVPMNYSVGNVISDQEGNLWFTSTRQGVMKIVPDRFIDISKLAGLDSRVINSTCLSGKFLYLGTDNGLEIINTINYGRVLNELTQLLDGIRIRCIKNDAKGRLWICTHGDRGLVCFDPSDESVTTYNEENGLNANRVRACLPRRDGSIAAATGDGLFIVSDGKVSAHYGQENGISTAEILTVEEDPDGVLYLGSDGDGVYVINGSSIKTLGVDDGLTSEVVLRIKWDEQRKIMWIITSNSIEYIKDNVIHAVTKFPYSNNYDILFDNSDDAWILASNGIYIADVKSLMDNERIEYSFYNLRSGLPYIPTGNARNYLSDDGMLYVSGTNGVCAVNINEDDPDSRVVGLAIPSVEIDDREISLTQGDSVSIPAGSRRLVINAYALSYGLSNPTISYYMDGFDTEPIITSKQDLQQISYTNLDGGRYVFYINVLDDKTGEIRESRTLSIIKERSIYDNYAFWLVVVMAGVAITGIAMWRMFSNRQQALLKKQQEDKKFIDQIMHTFAKSIDLRDQQNQGHSFRVAYYTRLLAEELREKRGYTDDQIDEFYHIALMHDIGKLSIPDRILNKPERLNDEEYQIMKTHAENGANMLRNVTIVKNLSVGAGCHHERMDGRGYPKGLKGDEIPEVARLIAVADTFDAMYSTRPYRKQLDINIVLEEMKKISGAQLEEEVVEALLRLAEKGELNKAKVDEIVANLDVNKEKVEIVEEVENGSDDPGTSEDEKFLNDLGF